MDKDFRLEQAKTFILEGNVQSALYRVVSYLQDKEVYDQRPYQEPVKVRVERPKTLEQESGLVGRLPDTESPIKVNLSGVGTDSMTPMTQPSLQSGRGTTTQSHVEQVLKCAHHWEEWTGLHKVNGHRLFYCYQCTNAWRLDDKILVPVAQPPN